jgi:hypothetical protein
MRLAPWLFALAVIGLAALILTEAIRGGLERRTGAHRILAGLQCIHRHEGSWTADTGNGYFGGLQMDASFERAYGGEFVRAFGHANNWPRALQLAAGVRGYLARGWSPWPNTSRMCGLQ